MAIISDAAGAGASGIGDDAAIVPAQGDSQLALSCDTLVEGQDFELRWATLADLGHKSLAVNLSDLAATGAIPVGCLLSLSLPAQIRVAELRDFAASLGRLAQLTGCPLLGGDLSATRGPLTISLTVLGRVEQPPLTRGTSQLGDEIHVSGSLGAAAAGLFLLQERPAVASRYPELLRAQLRPQAQLSFGQALARAARATAVMDLSDGLATDLPRLLSPGQGALLDPELLPAAPGLVELASEMDQPLERWTVRGGEDYCLLLSAAPKQSEALRRLAQEHGAVLHTIGRVTGSGKMLLGEQQLGTGFDHFGGQG